MLNRSDLVNLARSLHDETVLSVYIDGTSRDPANRQPWRISLDNALKDIRTWLENSSHTERENFEKTAALLKSLLGADGSAIRAPGWVAFITPERVWYAEAISTPMPTLAVWSTGICISPYIRALKQGKPVLLAVADTMHADLYRYEVGVLNHVERAIAEVHAEAPEHMGAVSRPGYHQGVRGVTGRDATERAESSATASMLRGVAARLAALAGRDGAILIGGVPGVSRQLREHLPADVAGRALILDDVDIHMAEGALTAIAERGASTLRNSRDRARIEEIVDLAGQRGRGTLGELDTQRALELREVSELYVTQRFLDSELADGELAVRNALDQGATIEVVSGDAAASLDEHGGIGARLRFRASMPAEETFAAADGPA